MEYIIHRRKLNREKGHFFIGIMIEIHLFILFPVLLQAAGPLAGESPLFVLDVKDPVIVVTQPVGGGHYNYAQPLNIRWTASDDNFGDTPISIELISLVGEQIYELQQGIPNTSMADVTMPFISLDQARIRVVATDMFGNTSIAGSGRSFSLGIGPTATSYIKKEIPERLKVYPNPANDILWVEISEPGHRDYYIDLINMSGQVIANKVSGSQGQAIVYFNTEGLIPGIYMVNATSADGRERLVKRTIVR